MAPSVGGTCQAAWWGMGGTGPHPSSPHLPVLSPQAYPLPFLNLLPRWLSADNSGTLPSAGT